jgi:hypothetical protein
MLYQRYFGNVPGFIETRGVWKMWGEQSLSKEKDRSGLLTDFRKDPDTIR